MNIFGRNQTEYRKRIYWIVAIFIFILIIKYGSKYIYLYTHDKECVANYLKKNNFSQKLENFGPYEGSVALCNEYIQHGIDLHRKIRMEGLNEIGTDKYLAKCIQRNFDSSDIKLDAAYFIYLQSLKADRKEFTDKQIEEHNKWMISATNIEKLKMNLFYYDCHLHEQYHTEFHFIYDTANKIVHPDKMSIAKKCFGDYLKKNTDYAYLVDEPLDFPEVETITCDSDVIAPLRDLLKDTFYHQKSIKIFKNFPKFRECLMQKAEDFKLIDKMVTISILGAFRVDNETKGKEYLAYSALVEKFRSSLYSDCLAKNEY